MRTYPMALLLAACLLVAVPASSFALGLEVAGGGWQQDPEGFLSYKPLTGADRIDLETDAKYDDEIRPYGRAKIDMPALLPNIYLMYTPVEFDGTGQKGVNFRFGDVTFNASVPFYSKVTLDHYDIALYYGLPFLETASAGKLNVELGLNARIIDFEGRVRQDAIGQEESKSVTIPVPMLYVGVQLRPFDWLAFEAEGRGIAYSGNHYYDYLGRVRVNAVGPLFFAAGWRMEDMKIDEEDVLGDFDFGGPFAEVGLAF